MCVGPSARGLPSEIESSLFFRKNFRRETLLGPPVPEPRAVDLIPFLRLPLTSHRYPPSDISAASQAALFN